LHSYHFHGPPVICITPLASNKIKVLGVCNYQFCQRVNCLLGKHLLFSVVYSLNITLYYFEKGALTRKSDKKNNKQGVGRRRTLKTLIHYTSSSTILDHMKKVKKETECAASRRDEKCV